MFEALWSRHHPLRLKEEADSREFSCDAFPLRQSVDEDRNHPGTDSKKK